jgi:hypothetical protein
MLAVLAGIPVIEFAPIVPTAGIVVKVAPGAKVKYTV